MSRGKRIAVMLALALLLPGVAWAGGASESFTRTSLLLILMITLADACGFLFERFGLPELVGEICAGILLGNLVLTGLDIDFALLLKESPFMGYAAELAVVLLLFLVGLESDVRDLLRVGRAALAVALAGVTLPLLLGAATATGLGLAQGLPAWFIGATLAATSVGITAKLLAAYGVVKRPSAEVILGAAVLDDILAVLLLAVLASVAASGDWVAGDLVLILLKALGFFAVAVVVGQKLMPEMVHMVSLTKHASIWAGFAFCLALGFAELAALAGMAPLVGAFVAGLLLDDVTFRVGDGLQKHQLEELIRPISDILISVFFVGIGAQVDLRALADPANLLMVAVFTLVAVLSKSAAGYCARGREFDRWGVGFGMIPRGEVGLVFASFALAQGVFCCDTYTVLVAVVLLTTLVGPALLKSRLRYF